MIMYTEIKDYILKCIDTKEYTVGYKLPPEREYTEKFKASRMTVRRAIDELIQEGILIKKKGKGISGTYVAKAKKSRSLHRISISTDKELIKEYGQIRIVVLERKVVKNHSLAKKLLKLKPEEVYQVKRIQYGWDFPIVYENLFFPLKYFTNIENAHFEQSMSQIIPKYLNTNYQETNNKVEIEAQIATPKLMKLLSITKDSPVLQLTNIVYDQNGNPIFCGIDSYDGTSFKYSSYEL